MNTRPVFTAWKTLTLAQIRSNEMAIECLKKEILAHRKLLRCQKRTLSKALKDENFPSHRSPTCCFGCASDNPKLKCHRPARWRSYFKGMPTELVWCDKHKVDSDTPGHEQKPIDQPETPGAGVKCKDCQIWDTTSELDCAGNKIPVPPIGFCPILETMTRRNFTCSLCKP